MTKLYLYTAFHANLKFSSIPEEQYSLVLDRCYWPTLDLLEDYDISLGLEFPASTLEIINDIDSGFIDALKDYWIQGKCEVIGSGYSQTIFPLIPAEANLKNLVQGNEIYKKILGKKPVTAYVNEQVYSSGLVEIYKSAGYENLIMDWDNATKFNHYPDHYKYKPTIVIGAGNAKMNLVWNNSISFQKFQRFAHGLLPFNDYIAYLESHYSEEEDRAFLLYGNDLEIFDYRPGKGAFLDSLDEPSHEFDRIRNLLAYFEKSDAFVLITPDQVVKKFKPEIEVRLESSEYPVITKKQDKYNVTRWAVCGRENSKINTQCYKLFNKLLNIEFLNGIVQKKVEDAQIDKLWWALTNLWSSDFRTHTTDEKYMAFRNRLGAALEQSEKIFKGLIGQIPIEDEFAVINPNDFDWDEPFEFTLQFEHGRFKGTLKVFLDGQEVKTQQEDTEKYRDGSIRTTRIVISPHIKSRSVVQGRVGVKEHLDENYVDIDTDQNMITTPEVKMILSARRGGTIKELLFPKISDKYLIGELNHGHFDDISFSPDWYSGHVVVYDRSGKKFTDLEKTELLYPDTARCPIRVPVKCKIEMPIGTLRKTYYIYVNKPRVDLVYNFNLHNLSPLSFRVGITTINPQCFDMASLRYSTVNGGKTSEAFFLNGKSVRQDDPVSLDVSTHHCLGATEGWVDIGDNEKGIAVITNRSQLYSVPLLHYEEINNLFFLRVYTSISEMDDTTESFLKGHNTLSVTFLGHKNTSDQVRRQSKIINKALILIRK
jgi:hypothetical protein